MRPLLFGSLIALSGCAAGTPPNPQIDGGPDAQIIRPDAGRDAGTPTDAGEDAGVSMDAGERDAGTDADAGIDAAVAMDAGSDAGVVADAGLAPIVIDGVIGTIEWAGAQETTSTTATIWAGSELRRMLVDVRDGRFYLAIEGMIEGNNAIVVYVDNDTSDTAGVADLATLTDSSGSLDNALSAGFVTPASFRADYAWGTQDMSRSAAGSDDRMGWRDIAVSDPTDFAWITASEAPTTCTANACETSIPLATLGGVSPRTIGLFARIANWDGTSSPNQTLPMDDPSAPRTVSVLMLEAD